MKRFLLICLLFISGIQFGYCDPITIIHTSDIHGRLDSIDYRGIDSIGGAARRQAYFNKVKQTQMPVLIFDSGDYYQGSLFYSVFNGKKSAKLLNDIHYDVMVFGNHEFDTGIKHLKKLVKISKTPYISTNLTFEDKYLSKHLPLYVIKEIDGKKILILGVTTSELNSLSNSEGVTAEDPVKAIKRVLTQVKADKIFVISHCGLEEDKRIAKEIPEVDLILGGHNHYFFKYPKRIGSSAIIQSGEFGVSVGRLEYDLDKGIQNFEQVYLTDNYESDTSIQNKIAKYNKKINRIKNNRICKLSRPILAEEIKMEKEQTEFGHLILNAMVKNNVKDWDVVLQNAGSIKLKFDMENEITYGDLYEILPFDNQIVSCNLQGKYLRQILEKGKIPGRSYLQYISKITKIEDNKIYKVVTVDYLQKGKDGYDEFKYSTDCKEISSSQVNLLKKYLIKHYR